MTAPSGPDRAWLDQLDALRQAATPGEWTAATAPSADSDETHAQYLTNALRPDEGRPLWVAWAPAVEGLHDGCDYVVPVVTGDGPSSEANAKYVAAMHDALPSLLAAARERDALRAAVEGLAENLGAPIESGPCEGMTPLIGGGDVSWRLRKILRAVVLAPLSAPSAPPGVLGDVPTDARGVTGRSRQGIGNDDGGTR